MRRSTRMIIVAALIAATSLSATAQTQGVKQSYNVLLTEAAARQQGDKRPDMVQDVLRVISEGAGGGRAADVVAALKGSYPAFEPGAPLLVFPEMREALVKTGDDYQKLLRATDALLQFTGLKGKVIPVLYRSEEPLAGFSYPNGLIFSTRMMALLSDDEIEALAAHELCHLVARDAFKAAVDRRDERALRVFELFCDGAGASVLAAMGKDPRRLYTGLSKQFQVYEVEYGADVIARRNPSMDARNRLNKELIKQYSALAAR